MLNEKGAFVSSSYDCSDEAITAFVDRYAHAAGNVIVIDAPLVCVNESGQRACETRVGRLYGKYHASCHSSNIGNKAGQRGPRLVEQMKSRLPISVRDDARQAASGLWPVVETYPHPGHVELFQLDRILKYKKKSVDQKRRGLASYADKLMELENYKPPLQVDTISMFDSDASHMRGNALKEHEDLLDALFCAYVALHLWHYRNDSSKWHVIRAKDSPDYITVPLR